jgi:predicted RNase H-like HicB family nuclease
MTLQEMLLLPWTWSEVGRQVTDGVDEYLRTIDELPGFFVAAASPDELYEEMAPALEAYLQSFVDRDEEPPLPNPGRQEWVFRLNGLPVTVAEAHATGPWQFGRDPARTAA